MYERITKNASGALQLRQQLRGGRGLRSTWRYRNRFLICPACGKRHDPRNRLLRLGFQREGYWKVEGSSS